MPRKPIACPSCGALVSSGRLSCPACGTLVATVTGAAKPATATPVVQAAPTPATPRTRPGPRRAAGAVRATPIDTAQVPAPAAVRTPWFAASAPPAETPGTPSAARPGSILQQVEARPLSDWLNSHAEDYDEPEPAASRAAIPGAYLAPSAAFRAPQANPRPGRSFEPPADAHLGVPAYATSATGALSPVAFAPTFGTALADARVPAAAKSRGISMHAPAELPGWLAIAGSAIAAMSFLMPWSRDGVIGAVGSGYFDRWGLANTGYLPLVLVALGLLVLNGVPNPIPSWIRAGIAPLAIGGILFGLDWAYQTRPYSDGLGVTLLLVSSLVLLAGGLIGVRSGRHPEPPPLV